MEIIKDIRNDLLKRQEINISLKSEQTPNFEDIKKQIAGEFKKSEEVIDVYNIKGNFGSSKFKIGVYIYDSKEDLEKNKLKKKKQTKEKKPVKSKTSAEDKSEQTEDKSEEKSTQIPAEDKQEVKAVKEEKKAEEKI